MNNNNKQTANKVVFWNNATKLWMIEICNDERLEQLKGFPFISIEKIERVKHDAEQICEIGGVTPAFKRMIA